MMTLTGCQCRGPIVLLKMEELRKTGGNPAGEEGEEKA